MRLQLILNSYLFRGDLFSDLYSTNCTFIGKHGVPSKTLYEVYSGISSKRINLSPFTKDFRGEVHTRSLTPIFGRAVNQLLI